jgi:predicted dehydrogenase
MATPLRVGIAGYGIVGKRRHEVANRIPELKVVAVCDRNFDGQGVLADGVRHDDNYRRMLETEDLDVLFVALSNDLNAEATIAGLEKGLHVFCEKPPARNVAEIAEVAACERRHPELKLKFGFNHRYHHSVLDALKVIRSGELGEIINLRGVYGKSKLITFDQTSWRTERDIAGGGVLLDQGIHMVDLIRLFSGEITDIHSFVSNSVWGHNVEDNVYAIMRTADGKVAMLHSSASQWRHLFNLEIALRRGTLTLSGILSGSKSYGAETLTVAWAADEDSGDPREQTTRYNKDTSWSDEIEEFTDSVLHDKPIVNGSCDEALKTMELVYRIYCADPQWQEQWAISADVPDLEEG